MQRFINPSCCWAHHSQVLIPPMKSRGKEPAMGGAGWIAGRAQEKKQQFSPVLTRLTDTFYFSSKHHPVEQSLLPAWKRCKKGFQCLCCLETRECKGLVDATCTTMHEQQKISLYVRQAQVRFFLRKVKNHLQTFPEELMEFLFPYFQNFGGLIFFWNINLRDKNQIKFNWGIQFAGAKITNE